MCARTHKNHTDKNLKAKCQWVIPCTPETAAIFFCALQTFEWHWGWENTYMEKSVYLAYLFLFQHLIKFHFKMSSLTLNDLQMWLLSCRWQSWEWPWEQSAVFCEWSLPCCPLTSMVYWRREAAWSVDLLPEDKEDTMQELSVGTQCKAKTLSSCYICTTVTVRQLLAITFLFTDSLQQCWKHKLYEEKTKQVKKQQKPPTITCQNIGEKCM